MRYQSFLTDSARWDGFSFRPHYEAKVRELASPDLVAWLHRETL